MKLWAASFLLGGGVSHISWTLTPSAQQGWKETSFFIPIGTGAEQGNVNKRSFAKGRQQKNPCFCLDFSSQTSLSPFDLCTSLGRAAWARSSCVWDSF